jgi:hypothetical protein
MFVRQPGSEERPHDLQQRRRLAADAWSPVRRR